MDLVKDTLRVSATFLAIEFDACYESRYKAMIDPKYA